MNVGVDHTGSFAIRDPQGRKAKRDYKSRAPRGGRQPYYYFIHHVLEVPRRLQGNAIVTSVGQPQDLHSGGDLPAGDAAGPHRTRISSCEEIGWKHQTPRSPWMGDTSNDSFEQ